MSGERNFVNKCVRVLCVTWLHSSDCHVFLMNVQVILSRSMAGGGSGEIAE